jgi:hypothetical protein
MGRKPKLQHSIAHCLLVIPFVQAHMLRMLLSRFWTGSHDVFYRFAHQLHSMAIRSVHSQANGPTMPLGQKTAFGAVLAPVCWMFARVFPSQRGCGDGSVHTQPFPVYPFQLIKALHFHLPKFQKHPRFYPFLETVVGSGAGNQIGHIQGFPRAAGAQDVENGVGALSV